MEEDERNKRIKTKTTKSKTKLEPKKERDYR